MSLIQSPELFINVKAIPDASSEEWHPFFQEELKKIKYGVTINGVYIHGWLYWHINHWTIYMDELDPYNNVDIIRVFKHPELRDNEWIIAEHLKSAEEQKKGLMIFGSRRQGKSEIEASWTGRGATIYEGSENVLSSTNEADIKVLASKVDKGLNAVNPYFRFQRLQDDWRKEVSLGYKAKKSGGERYEWSKIWIRNLDEGKNTEAIAGTTPKTLVIDEVGKANWLEAFEAAKPGFTSPHGWRCVPLVTGTGGTFEPNSDAQKVFTNPTAYNFLALEWPNKSRKYGVFMPGYHRMEGKIETKFGDYLQHRSGIIIPADSELNKISFFESSKEKAKQVTDEEIELLKKANDPKAILKARMYYPEDPDDCFLSADVNNFPVQAIEEHLRILDEQEAREELYAEAVELYRDINGKVKFTSSTKMKEIRDWPVNPNTLKDAPVVLYEPPIENPPAYLYIAGSDPYNVSTSSTSPSLGTVCIYKRLYDPVSGTFQNSIVASLASRPGQLRDWMKNVEMLLELYNATCMIENAGTNFIEYMDGKNKGHFLANGYNLLLEITPTTGIQNRPKGLPATPRVISHCMALAYDYCNEELEGMDSLGNAIVKLGVTRIKDRMLLIEMLNFNSVDNFDRIVAFRHALAYDHHLQKIAPLINYSDAPAPIIPQKQERHVNHSPFANISASPFRTFGKSPF